MHKSFLDRIRHESDLSGSHLVLAVGFGSLANPAHSFNFHIPTNAKTTIYDWLPDCTPDPTDNFFGVNRHADTVKLSGTRVNGRGCSPKRTLMFAAKENYLNGGRAAHCALNAHTYFDLAAELGYPVVESAQFDVELPSPLGKVTCFPDLSVKPGDGFLVQLNTWTLYGNDLLVCEAPGLNTRIKF